MREEVNHPKHYTSHPSGVECIDVNESMNYCIGNSYKYLIRDGLKNSDPLVDLDKSIWYIRREIERRAEPKAMERYIADASKIAEASPKWQGDALFELFLASLEANDVTHLKNALDILCQERSARSL
jgi:hypothetical protein